MRQELFDIVQPEEQNSESQGKYGGTVRDGSGGEFAVVLPHDPARQGQTNAGTGTFGGIELIKHTLKLF